MKTNLPLCKEPPMIANQFLALPLSIIFTQPQRYEDWFYNEFTQLQALIASPSNEMQIKLYSALNDGLFAPLDSIQIPYRAFDVGEDIVVFYRMLLKNGYYVRTFCNVNFFSELHIKNNFFHDFLIFGFDDNMGMFDVRAYQNYHLKDVKVSYNEMLQGHISADRSQSANQFITTYRLNEFQTESIVDCFSWRLMDYLGGINTCRREQMINYGFDPCCWGIRVYDLFDRFFENPDSNPVYIGRNSWYTVYEHKQHMQNKCRHFQKKGLIQYSDTLDQALGEICNTAMRCVFLHVKTQMKQKNTIENDIQALQRNVKLLKEQEIEIYTKLCRLNGWYVERG